MFHSEIIKVEVCNTLRPGVTFATTERFGLRLANTLVVSFADWFVLLSVSSRKGGNALQTRIYAFQFCIL